MKRVFQAILSLLITLLVISLLTFIALSLIPGNAAVAKLGTDATPEQIEALKEKMGLSGPVIVRYGRWLKNVLRGDFGMSLQYEGTSVAALLSSRLSSTLLLSLMSLLMIVVFSFPVSMLQVRHQGSGLDRFLDGLSQVMMGVPSFLMGVFLTWIFGICLHVFSPGRYVHPEENLGQCLYYLLFPALTVALPKTGMMVRFLTRSILSQQSQDYVRTARSVGAGPSRVLKHHILPNAMLPALTFFGLMVAEILAGSVIAEQVFSVPGVGRLLITSISSRDYPVVQAIVLYMTSVVVVVNFLVDLLYQVIDPRVRTSRQTGEEAAHEG